MKDQTVIKQRYMRDSLPVRLGGLATNLARVKSFSDHADHSQVVESLLDESKFFIEWTAPDAELAVQAQLAELHIQLAQWQHRWSEIWKDPALRANVAEAAQVWSTKVLEMSGLL